MKRKICITLSLLLLSVYLLSGCANNKNTDNIDYTESKQNNLSSSDNGNNTESKKSTTEDSSEDSSESELKEVNLSYYLVNTPQNDVNSVNEELNKILLDRINATVALNIVDWSAYEQKMNLMMAAGEEYDICFTSTWSNNYYQNVAKGAYIPIDDLLNKYAPETLKIVPNTFWNVAKVKGQTYGVINFQQAAAGFGISVKKSLADKYQLDWKSLSSFEDCEHFFKQIKENEPLIIPFGYNKTRDLFIRATTLHGFEAIGDTTSPGWIRLDDGNLTIINQFDSEEFKSHTKMMRNWYLNGYIKQDCATLKDTTGDEKSGLYAIVNAQIDISTEDWESLNMPYKGRMATTSEFESYDKKFIEPILTTEKAAATLTAISATSKNPERAMMFLELLNTDKDIYNLCVWGIENKHYTKENEVLIKVKPNEGYAMYSAWEWGFMGNSYLNSDTWPKGADEMIDGYPKAHKAWLDINTNAKPSPSLGFVFDFEPVKGEIATCKAIFDEMYYSIASGSVDPDKYIPIFNEKLANAGMNQIIKEKQKQINDWLKQKNQ